jgi:hypothetical protein
MSHDSVFNLDEALARVDHDRETFDMMVELFLEHGPKDLAETRRLSMSKTPSVWLDPAIASRERCSSSARPRPWMPVRRWRKRRRPATLPRQKHSMQPWNGNFFVF